MQSDEVIWQVINQQFCSFKIKTETQTVCRNENNVTGLCNRSSCPLANSRYATVREKEGIVYLYVKTIERAHTPAKMWEKIKLSKNYETAIAQIEKELLYWPNFNIHKCKQRLTKIFQYLARMRRLALKPKPVLETINKKREKRDAARERKAETAAKIEDQVEMELLKRLREGVYGELYDDEIVNYPQATFDKVVDEIGEADEENEDDFVELDSEEEEEEEEEDFDSDAYESDEEEHGQGIQDIEEMIAE